MIDAFMEQGRMTVTKEEVMLKEELALVTYMSLVMEKRLELVYLLAKNVEFSPGSYNHPEKYPHV